MLAPFCILLSFTSQAENSPVFSQYLLAFPMVPALRGQELGNSWPCVLGIGGLMCMVHEFYLITKGLWVD